MGVQHIRCRVRQRRAESDRGDASSSEPCPGSSRRSVTSYSKRSPQRPSSRRTARPHISSAYRAGPYAVLINAASHPGGPVPGGGVGDAGAPRGRRRGSGLAVVNGLGNVGRHRAAGPARSGMSPEGPGHRRRQRRGAGRVVEFAGQAHRGRAVSSSSVQGLLPPRWRPTRRTPFCPPASGSAPACTRSSSGRRSAPDISSAAGRSAGSAGS